MSHLLNHVFLQSSWDGTDCDLRQLIAGCPLAVANVARDFESSMLGAATTIALPQRIVQSSVFNREFKQALERVALIAALDAPPGQEIPQDRDSIDAAIKGARQIVATQDLTRVLLDDLRDIVQDEELREAFNELHRQGLVLVWSSLEVFLRSFLNTVLNSDIELAKRFVRSRDIRNEFNLSDPTWDLLCDSAFDISKNFGDIAFARRDIKDIGLARRLFKILYAGSSSVQKAVNDDKLSRLAAGRHVVVHNRGVIDQQYADKIRGTFTIGSKLQVSPFELEGYMRAACALVRSLIQTCQR